MGAPEMVNEYIQINTTKPPMDDVRVRKAFSMAIDRVALARFKHTAKALTSFVPFGVFPGYPVLPGNGFDAMKAKQLLVEAGYRDAKGNTIHRSFPSIKSNTPTTPTIGTGKLRSIFRRSGSRTSG